jgi:hypothetical protein
MIFRGLEKLRVLGRRCLLKIRVFESILIYDGRPRSIDELIE